MPKNPALEYSAAEPAFLRRIKAGNAALDGRHNVQIPRAKGNAGKGGRLDMGGEEGEDDPVMLDESGNVVTKEEMEVREKGNENVGEDYSVKDEAQGEEPRKAKDVDGVVSSGFGRKRKAVKVVEAGEGEPSETSKSDGDDKEGPAKSLKDSTKDLKDVVTTQKDDARKQTAVVPATKKGKRKKLKLSFDEAD